MSNTLAAGPYKQISLGNGQSAPLYLIDFDKNGRSEGPLTQKHLLTTARKGNFTDIYILSHGWNNVFADAVSLYEDLLDGYLKERQTLGLNEPANYRPLYVGIIWPSTALVLPWEEGPDFAGRSAAQQTGDLRAARREVAQRLNDSEVARFYELVEKTSINHEESLELARILRPIWAEADGEIGSDDSTPTPEEIVQLWRKVATRSGVQDARSRHGFADDSEEVSPDAAGLLDFLDPRRPVQLATVLLMKDRAGTVGSIGVGPLLKDLLAAGAARIHLVGHSYGCRVMLSALCYPSDHPRNVDSVLLLQPATSYLCFAANAGPGSAGGYHSALSRTMKPIFSTFSSNDLPLTKFFHLAVRRQSDLGDQQIAALPPSKFAALGGFGPGGLDVESELVRMAPKPFKYPNPKPGVRVYALNGTDGISGHGDVINPYTWWALLNQVSGDKLP